MVRNLAILLRFVGTRYHGWQVQKNAVTVGQTVRDALTSLCGHPVTLHGCGRTDAGVHAEKYVANFNTESPIPAGRVPYAMDALLPSDITILDCREVPPDFHAISCCEKKQYTYTLHNAARRDPFLSDRTLFYPQPIDLCALRDACAVFAGTHDFAAFRTLGSPTKSTVRTVYGCEAIHAGDTVKLTITADGFLYNMARTIAGTALYVSEGKLTAENVRDLLRGGLRADAGPVAPAHGLAMTQVWYPERYGLW